MCFIGQAFGRTSRHFIVHFEKIPTKKFPRYGRCAQHLLSQQIEKIVEFNTEGVLVHAGHMFFSPVSMRPVLRPGPVLYLEVLTIASAQGRTYATPNLGQMLPVITHEKDTFGFITAVTARKNSPMNFHERGYTCVVPARGYTRAVPSRHAAVGVGTSDTPAVCRVDWTHRCLCVLCSIGAVRTVYAASVCW